jgi:hypothetical protein
VADVVTKINPNVGLPAETGDLDTALEACRRVIEWFDAGREELLRGH